MNFLESFQNILERRGVTANSVSKSSGVSVNTIYTWQKGSSPSLDKLIPVADALSVSLDELAGRTPPRHTEQEIELLNLFRNMDNKQKENLIHYAKFTLS